MKPVIAAHKPVFIDKPLAAKLEDAREIARLAKEAGVPWFSSSGLRFGVIATTMKFPDAKGITVWGPGPFEEHHYLELGWYAIHPIEMLYAVMGPGCVEVTRMEADGGDVVTGKWKDGRIGTVRTNRPYSTYGIVAFTKDKVVQSDPNAKTSYNLMLKEIVNFFQTHKLPVSNEESLEVFAFMDAALRSKQAGGKPMPLR